MTREEIRKEIIALGAENVAADTGGTERINRWIQQAIRQICDHKPWPFLFDEETAAGPSIVIADLGHVISVSDLTHRNPIEPATLNQLLLGDPNLDAVGNSEYWFTENGTTIKLYPSSTASFQINYRKVPAELNDAGVPIIPVDYHNLIVSLVRIEVYKATDNFDAAAEILADYERVLGKMVHALMKPNYDKERRMTRSGRAGDYL